MASLMVILTITVMMGIIGLRHFLLSRHLIWVESGNRALVNESKQTNVWRKISIIMCLICITLYISLRWSLAIYNIAKYDLFNASVSEFRSANISVFLMLDLCSLLGVLLPILIIFDWKHRYLLRPVALLALLGGCATVFFTTPDLYSHIWNGQLFFIGSRTIGDSGSDEPLMFTMHFWMIVMALITLLTDKKITLKEYGKTILFILCYAGYISLCSQLLNIKTHVTATVIGDFVHLSPSYYEWMSTAPGHPSYGIFIDIYGVSNWKWASVVTWITFAVIVTIFVAIHNINYYYCVKNDLIIDQQTKFYVADFVKEKLHMNR